MVMFPAGLQTCLLKYSKPVAFRHFQVFCWPCYSDWLLGVFRSFMFTWHLKESAIHVCRFLFLPSSSSVRACWCARSMKSEIFKVSLWTLSNIITHFMLNWCSGVINLILTNCDVCENVVSGGIFVPRFKLYVNLVRDQRSKIMLV